jgi:general secretion pathway protein L
MSVLRIYAPLGEAPTHCEWALIDERQLARGKGTLAQLPRGTDRVQLVIPAAQVLIAHATLPPGARRRDARLLAFAVEDATASEPDANQVSWLGADALAVLDKQGLRRWRDALEAVGLRAYEVHSEILLLPRAQGEWSLAWDGREGFVRSGEFEGAATDGGDQATPPLALRLMLDQARPEAIAVYGTSPDLAAWQRELGIALRVAGAWDWRTAPAAAGIGVAQVRRRWRIAPAALANLRPAACLPSTASRWSPTGFTSAASSARCAPRWKRVSAAPFRMPSPSRTRRCRCAASSPRRAIAPACPTAATSRR